MKSNSTKNIHFPLVWRKLLNLTIFTAYSYASIEWVFFVTKPSALSILAILDSGLVLLVSGGFFALLLVAVLLFTSIPYWLVKNSTWKPRLLAAAHIVPALMLTVTALIMFDNFTYTVLKAGIVYTNTWQRGLYILGLALVLWGFIRFSRQVTGKKIARYTSPVALSLLVISTAAILAVNSTSKSSLTDFGSEGLLPSTSRPNIIILGSDGLTAAYLSAYGYGEETTPFLKTIMDDSLVAENAFPNASSTTGSTTSALTGKEPAVTKVYRYPDVLSGQDTLQHLPGILKQYGYKTVQVGAPYYVDAEKVNMLNSFDIINKQPVNFIFQNAFLSILGYTPSAHFVGTLVDRVVVRLRHIFFIEDMKDPVKEINNPKIGMTDEERVNYVIDSLDESKQPLFIFAHLMNTHGPHFGTNIHRFSTGTDKDAEWNKELYKDSILTFDSYLYKIYTHLEDTGQLENTILLIYTDHGYKYAVNHRIPLVIHFPDNQYAKKIKNNVQILDIPVTLLDYLNISRPTWMIGVSLLDNEPQADRKIVSIVGGSPRKVVPPFYQIKTVQFIICHKYFQLNVQEDTWNSGDLIGHTGKCESDLIPSEEEIHSRIVEYLRNFDYDVSSLE
jgi:glucan phosphoethanolaminetransferase (alkaline phosphatase superfamily)